MGSWELEISRCAGTKGSKLHAGRGVKMLDKVDQRFLQNKGELMGMFTRATGAPLCPHFPEILFTVYIYIYNYISISLSLSVS